MSKQKLSVLHEKFLLSIEEDYLCIFNILKRQQRKHAVLQKVVWCICPLNNGSQICHGKKLVGLIELFVFLLNLWNCILGSKLCGDTEGAWFTKQFSLHLKFSISSLKVKQLSVIVSLCHWSLLHLNHISCLRNIWDVRAWEHLNKNQSVSAICKRHPSMIRMRENAFMLQIPLAKLENVELLNVLQVRRHFHI